MVIKVSDERSSKTTIMIMMMMIMINDINNLKKRNY